MLFLCNIFPLSFVPPTTVQCADDGAETEGLLFTRTTSTPILTIHAWHRVLCAKTRGLQRSSPCWTDSLVASGRQRWNFPSASMESSGKSFFHENYFGSGSFAGTLKESKVCATLDSSCLRKLQLVLCIFAMEDEICQAKTCHDLPGRNV